MQDRPVMSVLAICRTMQINSRPTEVIIHSWALVSKMVIGVGDEFDSYDSTNQVSRLGLGS